jgi:NAD(P)-dependent dehydrogenase (short-subunit alcohol dehydrogenase family)
MARNGATVVVAARSANKGEAAVAKIKEELALSNDDARVKFMPLDLSSLSSVRAFANTYKKLKLPLHSLVLNAGVMKSPGAQFVGKNFTYGFDTTMDGFEMHIGVNHIGHFYLTSLLTEKLVASAPSRVVSVSSVAEEGAYKPDGIRFDTWKPSNGDIFSDYEDGLAYGQSKLANILFAKELASRLNGTGVTAYSCHPGVIKTGLSRHYHDAMNSELQSKGWFAKLLAAAFGNLFELAYLESNDGALTQLELATADESSLVNGAFYHPIGRVIGDATHPQGGNETLQKVMWTETERMIRSAGF